MDYPIGAAQVRDLIGEMMDSHCDVGEARDTGGGCGTADIWLRIGGMEYPVSVHAGRKYKPTPKGPFPASASDDPGINAE